MRCAGCNLQIEVYFAQVTRWIQACRLVEQSNITFQARQTSLGYIRGELMFRDGSILHIRELVDVEYTVDRLAYAYQWMDKDRRLIFRYDNAEHHPHIPSHPHHKHIGQPVSIVYSTGSMLDDVLREIELQINILYDDR